uniref:protein-tyrosine-phosphatase n=1 Tax=Schistocephalus solidus TaxID=70667 RepID=A0A0X3PU61_SCHSO
MYIVLLFVYATLKMLPFACTQSCNQGSFGEDCALQCHCRDNSCFNDVKSEGCQSGTCSPGYTGFPGCQRICPQGTFGVDCEGRCHCAPINLCLHTNGICEKPNRCVPERTGPSCQIVRPRLIDPPTVKVDCITAIVSWRGFKEENRETLDIRQYRIEIQEGHLDAFVEARTVESHNNVSDYIESFDDRRPDSRIAFRIVPVFFVDTGSGDGYLEDGIPSPPSKHVRIPVNEATVGPKSCALVGLGQTWAIFTWRPTQTCHLGSLLGYELSTTSMGSEVIVQRFLANTTDTVLLASDLSPGTEYKAEVLARFQKGNVRCLNSPLKSFKTPESGFDSVEVKTRERRYDNLAIQLAANSSKVQPKEYYVVSSAVKSQLAVQANVGVWSFFRVQSAPFHLTLTNLQPATEYRVYAWAPPVDGTDFQGTSADIWTSPKPFATSPNFRIDPHLMSEPSDTSVVVLYPNVSGYTGGLITDYYLAISPGHVGIEITPVPSSGDPEGHLSTLRRQLSLPPSAYIVHHSHDLPTTPITIGDSVVATNGTGSDRVSDERFYDPPLTPSSAYTLFVVVQSVVEASAETSPTRTFFFNTLPPSTSARTQVLVAAVLALLFALTIFLVAYFFYRRRKRQESSKVLNNYFSFRPNRDTKEISTIEDAKLDALPKSYAAWSLPSGKRDPRFLIIDPTKGPDSTLLGTKSIDEVAASFKREFDSLPTGRIMPHSVGLKTLNRYKNRSEQSLPYDHSRVKLKRSLNSPENDYINASFVDGYMRRKAYIAAQSPFNATTAADFWVMIFQCNVSQIVMLTNQIEGGAVCCTKYWPEVEQERTYDEAIGGSSNTKVERQYDSLLVLALDSTDYANFTVRRFQVSDVTSGAVQLVSQYHYHDWQPRRFCPSGRWHRRGSQADRIRNRAAAAAEELVDFDCLAFIDFYFHVVTTRRPEDGPLLVHCEEGVSRTSVFLAFDMLLQQFLTEHSVSVARLCASMRRARPNMIPTSRHYALLYDLLYEAGIGGQSLIDLNVRSVLKSLLRRNLALGITYLTEQWFLLHNFTPPLDRRTDSLSALASINVAKNRFPNILDLLPPDRFRPRLPPNYHSLDLPADYINAVYLDTVGLRDDLILTQTPLRSTVLDFWRMVFEERVSCIVDVEPSCYGSEDAVRYWPVSQADHQDSLISEDLADFHATTFPFDLADAEVVEALDALPDETSKSPSVGALGPWVQFGDFQLCQVGDLSPVLSSPTGSESKSKRRSCIFRRRLIIRKVDKSSLAKPPDSRTVQVFHFKGRWNEEGQIPAARAQFVRLLEVVRLERGLGPTIIHCLDGGTKSGLFAASYILVERITRDLFVDVFHTIKALKLRRRAVIGSAIQLRFLYRVLIDWVDMTIEKPLRRQQTAYPITFVRDPLLSTIHDAHSSGLLSSTPSHHSLASIGDSSACLHRGEETAAAGINMSNSMSAVYRPPRRNIVLYRYFSEELSKLMRSGQACFSPADAMGLEGQTMNCTVRSPRWRSRDRVSQGDLIV